MLYRSCLSTSKWLRWLIVLLISTPLVFPRSNASVPWQKKLCTMRRPWGGSTIWLLCMSTLATYETCPSSPRENFAQHAHLSLFPRGSVKVSLFVTNQLNSYGKVFNAFGNESVRKVMMDRNMVNRYQNCAQFLISASKKIFCYSGNISVTGQWSDFRF